MPERSNLGCTPRIDVPDWIVSSIGIEVSWAGQGILADKAAHSGVVVPRPVVASTASLAGKSTPTQMRGAAARRRAAARGGEQAAEGGRSRGDHHANETR